MSAKKYHLQRAEEISEVISSFKAELETKKIPQEKKLDAQLVLCEALANSFNHSGPPGCEKLVEVSLQYGEKSLLLRVKDSGCGFSYHPYLDNEDIPQFAESGRGIFLMSKVTKELWFDKNGTEVCGLLEW